VVGEGKVTRNKGEGKCPLGGRATFWRKRKKDQRAEKMKKGRSPERLLWKVWGVLTVGPQTKKKGLKKLKTTRKRFSNDTVVKVQGEQHIGRDRGVNSSQKVGGGGGKEETQR